MGSETKGHIGRLLHVQGEGRHLSVALLACALILVLVASAEGKGQDPSVLPAPSALAVAPLADPTAR